jgi:hypothetical protein
MVVNIPKLFSIAVLKLTQQVKLKILKHKVRKNSKKKITLVVQLIFNKVN